MIETVIVETVFVSVIFLLMIVILFLRASAATLGSLIVSADELESVDEEPEFASFVSSIFWMVSQES